VSYTVLIICVISMLALLFGLLGEFTIGLLLVRLEETAVGAAIGIGAAFLILTARTVTAARANIRSFLQRLADLVAMAGQQLSGQGHDDLLGAVWELDQQLAAVRTSIERLINGITCLRSRSRVSWVLTVLGICDHAVRGLARVASPVGDQAAGHALENAAYRIRDNIGLLVDAIDQRARPRLPPAGDVLDDAERMIASQPTSAPNASPGAYGASSQPDRVCRTLAGSGRDGRWHGLMTPRIAPRGCRPC
jgi:uncharacterized membrane protein YccC